MDDEDDFGFEGFKKAVIAARKSRVVSSMAAALILYFVARRVVR